MLPISTCSCIDTGTHTSAAGTAHAQREARRNGAIYQMGAVAGLVRSLAVAAMGGERLISRYDWLYGWAPT